MGLFINMNWMELQYHLIQIHENQFKFNSHSEWPPLINWPWIEWPTFVNGPKSDSEDETSKPCESRKDGVNEQIWVAREMKGSPFLPNKQVGIHPQL